MFLSISCILCFSCLNAFSAIYTVNGLGDAGTGAGLTGDLRYCITQANGAAGPHTINFSVAGTINLTATLPVFTRQISIQGNTAPGYALATPTVQLNGTNADWVFLFNNTGALNSLIQGVVLNRARLTNIEINGVNNITIRNCFIGTNLAGTASAGTNPTFGILLINSSNNTITGNVISAHATHGMLINAGSAGNTVTGNKIGTNATGTAAIPNAFHGIEINNSINNLIGGAAAGDRNILSGNVHIGLSLVNNSTGTQIINNYIGLNLAGTTALANQEHGILIDGSASATLTNNVVSGNSFFGVLIINCNNHTIRGNKIGTNAAGTAAIANAFTGLRITNSANAIVGGSAAGEGNVISGNGEQGLRFENSSGAIIRGNFIGTNAAGTGVIGNLQEGIYANTNCNNHIIGGNTAGARNVISGNRYNGIKYVTSCNDLIVEGNYIGTNGSGTGAATTFGNGEVGIFLENACLRPRIGGTTTAQRNIISGNGRQWILTSGGNGTGIQLQGGMTDAVITGNYIGLAVDGSTAMGNFENGIVVLGSDNVTIGGNTAATRNVISSNGFQGIVIVNSNAPLIIGNYCGTDATGALNRGNGQSGVILVFSNNGRIGRANANEGNLLSNNGEHGLHFVGGTNNSAYNNLIGVAANGTSPMGNANGGVYIQGVAGGTNGSNNTIGGIGALQANTIAYSTNTGANPDLGNGFGIGVAHNDQGINNTFIGNKIFCNAGLGIDLNLTGLFGGAGVNGVGNGGKSIPTITAVTTTSTSGTGTPGETIHVYSNVTCTTCQGETYLGTAVVTGAGTWSVTHSAVASPFNNSATATNGTLGTSQFSCNITLPIKLLHFTAKAQENRALLTWATTWEKDNKVFIVERSQDGHTFESIGSVNGQGSTSQLSTYSYIDHQPLSGTSYYRLKQIDINGAHSYSAIETVSFEGINSIEMFPNPATEYIQVLINNNQEEQYTIRVYSVLGIELNNLFIEKNNSMYTIDLRGLASGSYIISLKSATTQLTKTFLVY